MKNFNVAWEIQTEARTHEEAALIAAGLMPDTANTQTILVVRDEKDVRVVIDTEGGQAVVIRDERAYPSIPAKPEDVQTATVETLRKEIESRISLLRDLVKEPVSIRYGHRVSFELRPAGDDDRLLVCHESMGHTNVNYMAEGLVVDVWPNELRDGAVEPVFTQAFLQDEIQAEEAA